MKIAAIYASLSSETYSFLGNRTATLVAIEQLAQMEGLPVFALDLAAPVFARKYPAARVEKYADLKISGQYRAWRALILNAQMLYSPQNTDGNPWKSLNRALKLGSENKYVSLSGLTAFLPSGTMPADLTDEMLASIYETVPDHRQTYFRASLSKFRAAFGFDLVVKTGLLPATMPTEIVKPRGHFDLSKMSPEIESWRKNCKDKTAICALDYINRLAVAGELLDGESDSLDDLRRALPNLPAASFLGKDAVQPYTLRNYVTKLIRHIGGRDYRKSEAEQAWADLHKAARAAKCETSRLFTIAMPASKREIFPHQVTSEVALSLVETHLQSSTKSSSRRACEELDALRNRIPASMLPPEPIGVGRIVYIPKPPPPPLSPTEAAWKQLYESILQDKLLTEDFPHLWYLKACAIEDSLKPTDITQEWLENLRDNAPIDRLSALYGAVQNLRDIPGFEHLKPLRKLRERHDGVPQSIAEPLEALIAEMGLAPTSQRSIRLAVGILAETETAEGFETLDSLLEIDLDGVAWGHAQKQANSHIQKLLTIKRFRELPWTPSWKKLHKLVLETGTTISKNPAPKVLSWRPGCDPAGLTLEWAKKTDLELRSTLTNPPHGRADLANTFARHLALFDELHGVVSVKASGLLPKRLGNIR